MKAFKRIISLLLVVCMLVCALSLTACKKNKNNGNNNDNNSNDNTNTSTDKTYTVTIVDGDNNPVEGVKLVITDEKSYPQATSDASGKASAKLPEGTISVMITSTPDGYEKPEKVSGVYHGVFASGSTELKITLDKAASTKVTYTVTVVDRSGAPVEGVEIQLCPGGVCLANNFTTDENGEISVEITPGKVVNVKLVSLPNGYTSGAADASGYHATIDAEETDIEIEVTKN